MFKMALDLSPSDEFCRLDVFSARNTPGERVGDQLERARIHHAGGEPIGDVKALLGLAQQQNAAVRGTADHRRISR